MAQNKGVFSTTSSIHYTIETAMILTDRNRFDFALK